MDKTLEMAREAGFDVVRLRGVLPHVPEAILIANVCVTKEVNRLVALVRADERDKWMERAHIMILGEREAFNKERQQYAEWLDEAAADIEDWGMYASEYLQKKWDLPDQVQDYKNRAAAIRARGETK